MAEGINVRFAGRLQRFIEARTGSNGTYQSASEYIRDLVRHDFEREYESQKEALYQELKAGAAAPVSGFLPLDVEDVIRDAKMRRAAR
ncbi:MAG: type II toxin-antitoxin system ParD family antitoxin [Verrucomicrobiaceae bacterium]|nr:MAG: type II toxin-antitoxin system ParD family antitoxin [Verrucomicrobiaceae bacterium]